MTGLDVSSVAALLMEFAQRSALRGDNPFRTKAYARAADNLLTLTLPLDQVIAEERLQDIPGVPIAPTASIHLRLWLRPP
jgi:DNA polymerase (family X)